MGKSGGWLFRRRAHGICIGCMRQFVGPGDRCPKCQQNLHLRRKRKRR